MPRWLKAFPGASLGRPQNAVKRLPATSLVWLRLDPAIPALEQFAAIKAEIGSAHVIVLSNQPDNDEALDLLAAGARGYCNAHATAANLRQVADVVQAGGLWIGEALMQRLLLATHGALSRIPAAGLSGTDSRQKRASRFALLTMREQEVAQRIAGGSSNKEIARHLDITERTVKAHVGSIFQKLDARDRLHLALIVNGQRPA